MIIELLEGSIYVRIANSLVDVVLVLLVDVVLVPVDAVVLVLVDDVAVVDVVVVITTMKIILSQ